MKHMLFSTKKIISGKHISFLLFLNKILTSCISFSHSWTRFLHHIKKTVRPHSIHGTGCQQHATRIKIPSSSYSPTIYMVIWINNSPCPVKQHILRSHDGRTSRRLLPAFQASHSHGSGSDRLYIHVYHHRSFFQSWDESFRLCHIPTYHCWSCCAAFRLFYGEVHKSIPTISAHISVILERKNSELCHIHVNNDISYAEKLGRNWQRLYSWRFSCSPFLGKITQAEACRDYIHNHN